MTKAKVGDKVKALLTSPIYGLKRGEVYTCISEDRWEDGTGITVDAGNDPAGHYGGAPILHRNYVVVERAEEAEKDSRPDLHDLVSNLAVRLHELEKSHTVLDDDVAYETDGIQLRLDDLEDDMQRLFEMMDGIKQDVQTFAEMAVESRYAADKACKANDRYTNYINRGGCL